MALFYNILNFLLHRGSWGHVEMPPQFDSIEAQIQVVQVWVGQLVQKKQTDHNETISFFSGIFYNGVHILDR